MVFCDRQGLAEGSRAQWQHFGQMLLLGQDHMHTHSDPVQKVGLEHDSSTKEHTGSSPSAPGMPAFV